MFIANMKQMEPQKSRICRHNLRQVLGRMWVSNLMFWTKTHLLHYSSTRAKYSQERRAEGKWRWRWYLCELCRCDLELYYVVRFLRNTLIVEQWTYSISSITMLNFVDLNLDVVKYLTMKFVVLLDILMYVCCYSIVLLFFLFHSFCYFSLLYNCLAFMETYKYFVGQYADRSYKNLNILLNMLVHMLNL